MFRAIKEINEELKKDNPFGLCTNKSYKLKTSGKIHKFIKVENGLAYFQEEDGGEKMCGSAKWQNYFEEIT